MSSYPKLEAAMERLVTGLGLPSKQLPLSGDTMLRLIAKHMLYTLSFLRVKHLAAHGNEPELSRCPLCIVLYH